MVNSNISTWNRGLDAFKKKSSGTHLNLLDSNYNWDEHWQNSSLGKSTCHKCVATWSLEVMAKVVEAENGLHRVVFWHLHAHIRTYSCLQAYTKKLKPGRKPDFANQYVSFTWKKARIK